MQSYQPGKQLSIKFYIGVGPRILCVHDYPSEFCAMALEKLILSLEYGSCNSPKVFSGLGPSSSPKAFPGSSRSPKVFFAHSRHPMSPATAS
jgi:hypothetical protein